MCAGENHHSARFGSLARQVVFQMAEAAIPRGLFKTIPWRIRWLRMPELVPR